MSAAQSVLVDDRDSTVVYTGNWTVQNEQSGLFAGTDTWSETPGATVAFTFIGSVIEYWGTQGPRNGRCSVTVDGVDHGKVVAYNDTDNSTAIMLFRYTQDVAHTLASPDTLPANHTIIIGVTTDDDQPNGARCELDYFLYFPHSNSSLPPATTQNNPEVDRIQAIVLPSILVPLILAFLAWGVWWWYKHQRSDMRRELLDLRQAIGILRNPQSHDASPEGEVPPVPVMAAVRRRASDPEAPPAGFDRRSPDPEMGGRNMAGVGAGAISLPSRLGSQGGRGTIPPRRSSTAPGRGIPRPAGARPNIPNRSSPLSSPPISRPITSTTVGAGTPRRVPVMTPARRRSDPPMMATVREDGVIGGHDTTNPFRASTVRNDPDPNRPRAPNDDDDEDDE